MPAAEDLPSLEALTRAYQGSLVSERDFADTAEGAAHDHWNGLGAVMWRRQAERTREEFRALYFRSAKGRRLDDYVAARYPHKPRVEETRGVGRVKLTRPALTAGAGTFLAGTRIAVGGAGGQPLSYYLIAANTPCSATSLTADVAVEAESAGLGAMINVVKGDRDVLRVEDSLWDNTWEVQGLACADGTLRELDDPWSARLVAELFEERYGYESAIIKKMKEAGAETVVLFRSDYLGEASDHGLNRIYVADASFETSPELLLSCRLAAPSVVIAGASNQILPVTNAFVNLSVQVSLWGAPERFAVAAGKERTRSAAVGYFETRENPFVWDLMGLRGAIQRAIEDTQDVTITPSVSPPDLATLFNVSPLPHYRTTPERVTVSFTGPT